MFWMKDGFAEAKDDCANDDRFPLDSLRLGESLSDDIAELLDTPSDSDDENESSRSGIVEAARCTQEFENFTQRLW